MNFSKSLCCMHEVFILSWAKPISFISNNNIRKLNNKVGFSMVAIVGPGVTGVGMNDGLMTQKYLN